MPIIPAEQTVQEPLASDPTPRIVVPEVTAEGTTPEPTVTAVQAASSSQAVDPIPAQNAAPRQVAPVERMARPDAEALVAADAAAVPVVEDGASAEGMAALAQAERATARPVSDADTASDDGSWLVMAGGGLALGLGLIGILMAVPARRRRRYRQGVAGGAMQADERPVRSPHGPVATPIQAPEREAAPTSGRSKWDDAGFVNASPALGIASSRIDFRTPEGRRALLDRLVRARPDAANPFRSGKARRRRARLIVQTLSQRLREQPNLDFARFYRGFGRSGAAAT